MTKRKPLTRKQAKRILERQGGVCAAPGCKAELILGPRGQHVNWIDEHIIPLGLGGTNALKNREARCIPHAREKTNGQKAKATARGTDNYEIKKANRVRRKAKCRTKTSSWTPAVKYRPGDIVKSKKHRWQHRPLRSRPMRSR